MTHSLLYVYCIHIYSSYCVYKAANSVCFDDCGLTEVLHDPSWPRYLAGVWNCISIYNFNNYRRQGELTGVIYRWRSQSKYRLYQDNWILSDKWETEQIYFILLWDAEKMGFSWTAFHKLFPPGQLKGVIVENHNVPLFWWDVFNVQVDSLLRAECVSAQDVV